MAQLRVVSLLPSATDTVIALNLQHLLVGRSHEVGPGAGCNRRWGLPAVAVPTSSPALSIRLHSCLQCDAPEVQGLPTCTSSRVGDSIPVAEIDAVMVRAAV